MNIGIDVDGVIADLVGSALNLVNSARNTSYTNEDVKEWNFFKNSFKISSKEQTEIFNSCWKNWKSINLVESYVSKFIKDLCYVNNVLIISHRHKYTYEYIIKFLNYNCIEYNGLILLDNKIQKLSFPIDILIDDSPKEVENSKLLLRSSNKLLLLRNQPWNSDIKDLPDNVIRINSLLEVNKFI
mgnify:CR=1 FL=1